jgi:hypothetical protein
MPASTIAFATTGGAPAISPTPVIPSSVSTSTMAAS